MDPTATLARIRELVRQVGLSGSDGLDARLAESVDDLDEWLTNGGFLPMQWRDGR